MNLKHALCQIYANADNLHLGLLPCPYWLLGLPVWHIDAVGWEGVHSIDIRRSCAWRIPVPNSRQPAQRVVTGSLDLPGDRSQALRCQPSLVWVLPAEAGCRVG